MPISARTASPSSEATSPKVRPSKGDVTWMLSLDVLAWVLMVLFILPQLPGSPARKLRQAFGVAVGSQ